ncbi:MAG TPA: bifunctional proline dehydrogenase/L-glutamate gamma-semialdehyde dehydrogenase, partial [Gammaproteobacteria bacterium]|nr:bifunctional proline dehydrogenase/L-glutamate gamma-semialdehyde dehydrogenase [Gammaproteobacteria bacterium]
LAAGDAVRHPHIALPADIFGASRRNAKGWDITDSLTLASLNTSRDAFATQQWHAGPCMDAPVTSADTVEVHNPARPDDRVGQVTEANAADIDAAINAATLGARTWAAQDARTRADCLRRVADVYEAHAPELFALACREAGKSLLDAVNEVREAVDFARYYANDAERLADAQPRGVIACISPWNFPLA